MPTARYWRLTPGIKSTPTTIELSGIRFLKDNTVLPMAGVTTRLNFTGSIGSADILRRTDIVDGESFVFPNNRGVKAVVYDFQQIVDINTFQIGFGSNELKSLTKFTLEYSQDGLSYTAMTRIAENKKLKYTSPYTFSTVSNPDSGYPAVMDASFLLPSAMTSGRFWPQPNFDSFKRRVSVKNIDTGIPAMQSYNGGDFFIPLTGWVKPGRHYFEFSMETVNNVIEQNCIYIGMGYKTPDGHVYTKAKSLLLALNQPWNGRCTDVNFQVQQNISQPITPAYTLPPGGKRGYQGGIAIDLINGVFQQLNSPYIANFNYLTAEGYFATQSDQDSVFFFLVTGSWNDSNDIDFSFNFGQKPWVNPPPVGYDSLIGSRHEVVEDTTFNTNLFPSEKEFYDFPIVFDKMEIVSPNWKSRKDNLLHSVDQKYFIKGNVETSGGEKTPKIVKLLTFPELTQVASTKSRASDGLYEFLHLKNRTYAIVSQDLGGATYNSEIIGPIKPSLMES